MTAPTRGGGSRPSGLRAPWGTASRPSISRAPSRGPRPRCTPRTALPSSPSPITSTADIVNTGHAVQVSSPRGDVLTLGRDSYELLQFHFHTPSEHTVNGQRFPLEAHFVHRAPDGRLAVVAVLFRAGAPNAGLRPVVERLPARKGVEFHYEHLETDASYFLPKDRTTFRYEGSLTTPPCTEGVAWVVFASPVSASAEQIAALRRASGTNSRPRQAAFGRSVTVERLGEPAL